MNETSKTNKVRGTDFAHKFLQGKVLDIGCGKDMVCQWAQPFDQVHGDAQHIGEFLSKESYDTVYSSHCLEHMPDPLNALEQWWSLVKPGGFLVTVVPHEDLYEQGVWPSRFNHDHKATFRLGGETKFSPVSYDIEAIISALPGANLVAVDVHDQGYDYNLLSDKDTVKNPQPLMPLNVSRKLLRLISKPFPRLRQRLTIWVDDFYFYRFGLPVDQTARDALAQIQVIAQKHSD